MTRRRIQPIPPHMLTGTYFSELVKRHNWPPMFEPSADAAHKMPAQLGLSPAERERRAEQGVGWGAGTVVMPGTPGNARPAWMVRSPRHG